MEDFKLERLDTAHQVLAAEGVAYTIHNQGLHFKLSAYGCDFWPTTCKWMHKGKVYKGDVLSLLGFLRNRGSVSSVPAKPKKDVSRHLYGPSKPIRTPCTNPILPPFDGNSVPWD
jgi:hypothetical protein